MGKYDILFDLNKKIFRIYGGLITLKRINLLVNTRSLLKRNIQLKQERRSDVCYVIGLGPSLKEVRLDRLDGDLIVSNRFFKVPCAEKFSPIAYVMTDNAFFNSEKADLTCAIDMFPKTNFVLNGRYYKNVLDMYNADADRLYYLNMWNGFFSYKKEIDICKLMPMSNNVICTAVMLALYMGYKEIYLLGCDFNSFASQTALHVYKDDNKDRIWKMSDELFQYSFAADTHVQLERYGSIRGIKVMNATRGSLIDAYARVELDVY